MSTKSKETKTDSLSRKDVPGSLKSCAPKFFEHVRRHRFKKAPSFCEYLGRTNLYDHENEVIENWNYLKKELFDRFETKGYTLASAVLDLSLNLRGKDLRDDEITYRALHDMEQAIWVLDAAENGFSTKDTELVIALNLIHDLGEEYEIRPEMLVEYLQERGIEIDERIETFLKSFDAISKYYGDEEHEKYKNKEYKGKDIDGHYRDEPDYQRGVREDPLASVSKMFDRVHNLMTLIGVRDKDKIRNEIEKTMLFYDDYFFEQMCETFPENREIYKMLEEVLDVQLRILRYYTQDIVYSMPEDEYFLSLLSKRQFENMPAGMHMILALAERARTYAAPESNNECNNEPT